MSRRQSSSKRAAATAACAPARQPTQPRTTWSPDSMPVINNLPANAAAGTRTPVGYPATTAYGHPGQSYGTVLRGAPAYQHASYGPSAGYGHVYAYPPQHVQAYHIAPPIICNGSCHGQHPTATTYGPPQYTNMNDQSTFPSHLPHHLVYHQQSASNAQRIPAPDSILGNTRHTYPIDHNSDDNYPTTASSTSVESLTQPPTTSEPAVRPTTEPRRGSRAVEYFQRMNQRPSVPGNTNIEAPVKRAHQSFSSSSVRDVPNTSYGSHWGPYANGIGASQQRRASSDTSSPSEVSSVHPQESSSATGYDSSVGSNTGSPNIMQASPFLHQQHTGVARAHDVSLRPLVAAGTSNSVPHATSSTDKRPLPPLHKEAPSKVPRWYCVVCADAPKGFGAWSELERHIETKHPQGGETLKWIAIPHKDIEGDHQAILARGNPAELMQLARRSTCNSCRYVKYYAREDNAASHLRRCHFNRREQGAKNQHRGGKSGGSEPALQWLKDNHYMLAFHVEGPDKKWLGAAPPPGGRASRRRRASAGTDSDSSSMSDVVVEVPQQAAAAPRFSHNIDMSFNQQASFDADGSAAGSALEVNDFFMPMGMSFDDMYQFQGAIDFMPRLLENEVSDFEPLSTTCPWDVLGGQQPLGEEQAVEREPFDDLFDWSAFNDLNVTG